MHRSFALTLVLFGAIACTTEEPKEPSAEEQAKDKCPKIGMDVMAGKWLRVEGQRGDHTYRFDLTKAGDTYDGVYVAGGFTKLRMKGERRSTDHKLVEQISEAEKERFAQGAATKQVLYIEPRIESCSLRVSRAVIEMKDGKEVERPIPGFHEYLEFPENQKLTFEPCTETAFIGDAAKTWTIASKQLEELGTAAPNHELGEAIPVAAWTDAEKDGDAACKYDMDLYFDDRPVEGKTEIAAGEVKDGKRHWFVEAWSAPYSGNHHFEIFRYKTCEGAERELIGVSCLEAVLN